MNPVGIFGGTFDPVHRGHIEPILDVCRLTGIQDVRYVPNARPGHRSDPLADARVRRQMLTLALADYPQFSVDNREIRRPGKSYMVPTLRSFRMQLGFRPLCLILGIDAFLHLKQWYWWAEILRLANIVVMDRPGFTLSRWGPDLRGRATRTGSQNLYKQMSGCICHVPVTTINVSSTRIRKKVAFGLDIAADTPVAVSEYIRKHGLYEKSQVNFS